MQRLEALRAVYPQLEDRIVVTIMGAVSAELQSLGHRPNFFYLQHAMGLASSMGLGIALSRPDRQVVVGGLGPRRHAQAGQPEIPQTGELDQHALTQRLEPQPSLYFGVVGGASAVVGGTQALASRAGRPLRVRQS